MSLIRLAPVLLFAIPLCIQAQPIAEWIRSNAIRLQTPEAGHGFADMQPLKKIVGDARIVSLGEATHGTREFFQMKHRMLEFLALEMGFTLFSIEANMPEAYKLNDFVLNGNGDPGKLIKGMYFWTWDTQEVLDMVLWMREFNKAGKGRVEFTGFDMQTPAVAAGIARDFLAKRDPDYLGEFDKARSLADAPVRAGAVAGNFGVATGTFPVKDAAGKTIRFSGYIMAENVTEGYAGLWWRVDGPVGDNGRPTMLGFDNMQSRGVKGTTEWKQYTIEMPVPANATNINFGALFTGHGTAWFDGFTVEVDGKPYQTTSMDLDFEALTGFYAGGNGYRATLDSEIFHSGKRSLRLAYAGAPKPDPNAVDPKTTVEPWQRVVEHMESSRTAYQQKGASQRDTEWAIQNARVVLQCTQMRAGEVSRDASMAANVKWILDQNPKAKIVLWAHNGHVARQGSFASMGSVLSKMYGPQMVVFGFTFNQGSFQAVSQGKGLKDFTVPPAPAASLDATFASAGIPLFALDLHRAQGPAAAWLAEGHDSRNIGALYPEDQPFALMYPLKASEAYDALFFVEKTSAARKNPAVLPAIPYATTSNADGATTYSDPDYSAVFTLPAGWTVSSSFHWGDRETTAVLQSPGMSGRLSLYYQARKPDEDISPEARERSLAGAMDAKVAQRNASGLTYAARQDGCRSRLVDGSPARSCVGELTQNGAVLLEYLTWVEAGRTRFLLFGQVPAAEFDNYRKQVDAVLNAIRLR